MVVIVPHQDIELKLIQAQKKLIMYIAEKKRNNIFYSSMPLWIKTEFENVEQAKKEITGITIISPEYDEQKKCFVCPVKIKTNTRIINSNIDFINRHCEDSEHSEEDVAIHIDDEIFPLDVKIFRLGECHSPSPGFFELCNTVWKKLT